MARLLVVCVCLVGLSVAPGPLTAGDAGTVPPAWAEQVREPLVGWLAARDHGAPDSIASLAPERARIAPFRTLIRRALDGGGPDLPTLAAAAGYKLLALVADGAWYLVLDDATGILGPTVVIAPAATRDLIAEAPHPVADTHTVYETALFVTRLGARAAVVAGAHRCAAAEASPCSGTTGVCKSWGKAAYRDSDVAHNPESLFQAAHEELAARWPGAVVFSIHGFGRRPSAPDTWAVISDGGGSKDGGGSTRLTRRLRDALRANLDGGPARAVACDDPEDLRFGYAPLCAATNVQGRQLNGSADICRRSVPRGTGRFLHIEQTRDIRDAFAADWRDPDGNRTVKAVLDAVAAAVPCLPGRCP